MQEPSEDEVSGGPVPRPLRRLSELAVHVGALMLQVGALGIVVNALYRYTLGGGFPLISETSRFILLYVVFLGLAGTHLAGGHVQVQLLLHRLTGRARSILTDWIVPLSSLGFLALIGWAGWVTTLQMFARGTTTPSRPPVPLWPVMAVVPLGCALLGLVILAQIALRLLRAGGRS